jgi:DNA-binding MarR family transcriptional regulator
MADRDDSEFGFVAGLLGYQLRRLDVLAMADLGEMLGAIGLTPARATALQYVNLHEGCDQTALGNALGINRASAMAMVNQLVALGAIERRPGRDRRSNALHMTEAGRATRAEAERLSREQDMRFFGVLTAPERAELDRLVRKLRHRNAAGGKRPPEPGRGAAPGEATQNDRAPLQPGRKPSGSGRAVQTKLSARRGSPLPG